MTRCNCVELRITLIRFESVRLFIFISSRRGSTCCKRLKPKRLLFEKNGEVQLKSWWRSNRLFAHLGLCLDLRQLFHALSQLHSKLCVFVAHLWDLRAIFLTLLFNRNQSTIVTKLSSCASVTHFIKLLSLSGNLLARLLQLFVNNRLPSTLLAFSFSQLFFRLSLLRQQLRYLSRKLVHAVTWFLTRSQSYCLVTLLQVFWKAMF